LNLNIDASRLGVTIFKSLRTLEQVE
jgi:hypothetical protein